MNFNEKLIDLRKTKGMSQEELGAHWIEMGEILGEKAPKIFNVNWFRQDENGKFMWPGFGDNLRVLDWILERCEDNVDAKETPIGYLPYVEDINTEGLDIEKETLEKILTVNNEEWLGEAAGIEEFYQKFGDKLPAELKNQLNALKQRLSN